MRERFWENYSPGELNTREWEALCDGCGQCCLVREVNRDKVVVYNVGCDLLDIEKSRCRDYTNRSKESGCHQLTPANIGQYDWLPESCTYRRLHRGEPLPAWHPLLNGNRQRMRRKGITVCGHAVSRSEVPRRQMSQHIIARWRV